MACVRYNCSIHNKKIEGLFVPKFYHEKRSQNFLKTLNYIGERDSIDDKGYSEFPDEFGIKLYEYQKDPAHNKTT